MHDQLSNGRKIRLLNIVDECTRMCLKIDVKRSMGGKDVLACLSQTMAVYGVPDFIRSDNGSEFIEKYLREWLLSKAPKRCMFVLAVRGRTENVKALTGSFVTNT